MSGLGDVPEWAARKLETGEFARLLELAERVAPGPWNYRRSHDGALIVWDSPTLELAEPLALAYAGTDWAQYVCAVSPAVLLDGLLA